MSSRRGLRQVSTHLPTDMADRLEKRAFDEDRTVSAMLRLIVRRYLETEVA